jgi:hypothetical protein
MTRLLTTIAAVASVLMVGCGVTAQQKHAIARAVTAAVVGSVFQVESKGATRSPARVKAEEEQLKPAANRGKKPCNSANLPQSRPLPATIMAAAQLPKPADLLILPAPPMGLTFASFDSPGVRSVAKPVAPAFHFAYAIPGGSTAAQIVKQFRIKPTDLAAVARLTRCAREVARIRFDRPCAKGQTIRIRTTTTTEAGKTHVFVIAGFGEGSVSGAGEPDAPAAPIL